MESLQSAGEHWTILIIEQASPDVHEDLEAIPIVGEMMDRGQHDPVRDGGGPDASP